MGNVYTCHLVKNGATALGGIKNLSLGRNLEALVQGASGGIEQTFAGKVGDAPVLTVDTIHCAAWWTALGLAAAVDAAGLTVGFQKLAQVARAGTLSHVLATIYDGVIVLSEIGVQHGQEAKATYEVHGADDGTNGAMSVATGVTLTGDQTVTEKYVCGPVKINGTTYETSGWSFRPGHKMVKKSHSGKVSPQFVGIGRRAAEVSITSDDLALLDVEIADITSLVLYLRKEGRTGPEADVAVPPKHMSLTFVEGIVWAESAEAGDDAEGSVTLSARPIWDGTNDLVQVSVATDIS